MTGWNQIWFTGIFSYNFMYEKWIIVFLKKKERIIVEKRERGNN